MKQHLHVPKQSTFTKIEFVESAIDQSKRLMKLNSDELNGGKESGQMGEDNTYNDYRLHAIHVSMLQSSMQQIVGKSN